MSLFQSSLFGLLTLVHNVAIAMCRSGLALLHEGGPDRLEPGLHLRERLRRLLGDRVGVQQAVGRVAGRAWCVLWSGEQVSVPEIAARLHCKHKTVRKWLRRYQQDGGAGLEFLD